MKVSSIEREGIAESYNRNNEKTLSSVFVFKIQPSQCRCTYHLGPSYSLLSFSNCHLGCWCANDHRWSFYRWKRPYWTQILQSAFLERETTSQLAFLHCSFERHRRLVICTVEVGGKFILVVVAVDTILCFKTNKNGKTIGLTKYDNKVWTMLVSMKWRLCDLRQHPSRCTDRMKFTSFCTTDVAKLILKRLLHEDGCSRFWNWSKEKSNGKQISIWRL